MKKSSIFFKPYNKHGLVGYHIPVRNTFSKQIEQEYIPAEAKDMFEAKFGETVISDEVFLEWYTEIAANIK